MTTARNNDLEKFERELETFARTKSARDRRDVVVALAALYQISKEPGSAGTRILKNDVLQELKSREKEINAKYFDQIKDIFENESDYLHTIGVPHTFEQFHTAYTPQVKAPARSVAPPLPPREQENKARMPNVHAKKRGLIASFFNKIIGKNKGVTYKSAKKEIEKEKKLSNRNKGP